MDHYEAYKRHTQRNNPQPIAVRIVPPPWKRHSHRCPKCWPKICKCVRPHSYPQKVTFEGVMIWILLVAIIAGTALGFPDSPGSGHDLQPPTITSIPSRVDHSRQAPTGGGRDKRATSEVPTGTSQDWTGADWQK